ncbi:MAG: hypothetical protein KBS84_10450 [Treponema sp.]|nr:hypothetical protein [Candidatus Treponema scatequi]
MKAESLLNKITENWKEKSGCVVAAVVLILVSHTARLETKNFFPSLKTVEDGSMTIVTSVPETVNVSVRHDSKTSPIIKPEEIQAYIDVSYFTEEGTYNVPVRLSLSSDLLLNETVEFIANPSHIQVTLEEKTRRSVPIKVPVTGNPLHGYEVSQIKVHPEEAIITGPRKMVEKVAAVNCEEVVLTDKKDDFETQSVCRNPNKFIHVVSPYNAVVSVSLQASLVTRKFDKCRVFFANLDKGLVVESQPEISFTVSGAELVLEKFYPSEYTVQCDCSNIYLPGEYELPIVIAVQDALKIEDQSVEKVKVLIKSKPAEAAPAEANKAE